jgi:hypothetical protein
MADLGTCSRTFRSNRISFHLTLLPRGAGFPILTRLIRLTLACRLFSRLCNFGQPPITRVHVITNEPPHTTYTARLRPAPLIER